MINQLDQVRSVKIKQGALLLLGMFFLIFTSISFERCGIWKNTVTLWSDVIRQHSNDTPIEEHYIIAYNNRGLEFFREGKLDLSFKDYFKAIEINPNNAEAYNNLSVLYAYKGDLNKSIQYSRKAIELKPDYADAYYNQAISYYTLKEYDKAWDDARQIKALNKDVNPDLIHALRQVTGKEN